MNQAHRRVTINVFGPADTTISLPSLYCGDNEIGAHTVKKAVRAEAERRGIKLGRWDHLKFSAGLEWEGGVYGEWGTIECAYCSRDVTACDVPAVYDDAAWTDLAREHAPSCEWILTRAHRMGVPALTPAETDAIEAEALNAARDV